jgi:hypothetical protein
MKGVGFYIPAECPKCHSGSIESILVAQNEEYSFNYSEQRGVTLEFLGC